MTEDNGMNIGDGHLSRRGFVSSAAAIAGGLVIGGSASGAKAARRGDGFGYCLNTGTIRGQKLGIIEELEVAAKAGYDGIEPWIDSIHKYKAAGGSLKDLKKRIEDMGISVESAIGFAQWITDDDARRAKGLEQFKRDMDVVGQIGGKRVAAPPAGANRNPPPGPPARQRSLPASLWPNTTATWATPWR